MNEVYLAEVPALVAGGFEGAAGVGCGWVAVPFETESLSGQGVATGAGSAAQPLRLHLGLEGRYRLHLALGSKTALRVWWEGEEAMAELTAMHGGNSAMECVLAPVDCTGRTLCIEPRRGASPQPAFLAWIRAERVCEEPQTRRNLVATNDGYSWIALGGLSSVRDVRKIFEPLRDSDFGLMLWGPGGADWTMNHLTAVGTLAPQHTQHAFYHYDSTAADAVKALRQSEGDILREAIHAARDVGVKLHFYIRPEAFFCPFPNDGTFTSAFFASHPEYWCRDEAGEVIHRLSYGYSQVQAHMWAYCEELLSYEPDGLCFAFNRGLPMVICEEPVCCVFEQLHGRLPQLPEEGDSAAMAAARASILESFLQECAQELHSRGKEFTCISGPNLELNRLYGLDLSHLCREGVFDRVMLHDGGFHATAGARSGAENGAENQEWLCLAGQVPVYANGWGGSYDHEATAQFLLDRFASSPYAGAFFWDTENLSESPFNWHVVRFGGNGHYLAGVAAGEVPSPRQTPFTRIRNVKLGRYSPWSSY